jgi:hypothetical protein
MVYRVELSGLVDTPVSVNLTLRERCSLFLQFLSSLLPLHVRSNKMLHFSYRGPYFILIPTSKCKAWWALHPAEYVLMLPGCCRGL